MITRIRHRGLRLYPERGERRLLPQAHIKRIDLILTRLRHSSSPSDMDVHGLRLHPLRGDLEGFWSVRVSANLWIIFRFEGPDAVDVDLIDYH